MPNNKMKSKGRRSETRGASQNTVVLQIKGGEGKNEGKPTREEGVQA